MTTAEVLSLPRADAFARGLLLAVAPWRRREHAIPLPVRFTALAWTAFVAYPGPRGGAADPRALDARLERVLLALANAISAVGCVTFSERTMNVLLPSWVGPTRPSTHDLSMVVVSTIDEEGQDTLTIMTPAEERSL